MSTPIEFMAGAKRPLNGSSAWSSRYAAELRRIFYAHAARAPRTLQKHLGPSELGSPCDRQVVGKMAGEPATNHVFDPWPSIRGTALHAWAAEAFTAENMRGGVLRFIAEKRVIPHVNHPGTADLYDAIEWAVVDHKFLGASSMQKIQRPAGPPRKYVVQLLLYGLGYLLLGLPVKRIAVAAYPATASTLDGLYVWDRDFADGDQILPENLQLLTEVFAQTENRHQWASALASRQITLNDISHSPDDDECYFCPFYRPQAAHDSSVVGCPGTVQPK